MSRANLHAGITAGTVIALLNITTAVSMAALLFAGLPANYFVIGVSILLLSTAVCAIGGVIGCGVRETVLAPRSGLAPIYAAMVISISGSLAPDDPGFLPTVLATIAVGTLFTAGFLVLVGWFRLGALIRYVPYPVMAGFFAGIGLIFILGSLTVAGGVGVNAQTIGYHLSAAGLQLTIPAIALGLLLYAITMRIDHWMVFPLTLGAAVLVFYGVLWASGATAVDAVQAGWLPEPSRASLTILAFRPGDLALIDWPLVFAQAGAFVSLALLSTIILLVDTSGIEMIAGEDLNPDRELRVAGFTNAVNGLLGGYVGVQTAADTALFLKVGAKGRLPGVIYAGLVAVVLYAGTDMVAKVPSFVLGGLLFYLGLDFLIAWAWSKRRDFPLHDYVVIVAILAAIVVIGLLEGIAFGFFLAIIIFVLNYSRLNMIKSETTGDIHDGIVVRNVDERQYLKVEDRRICIMMLQGFLFFGTADRLFRTIRRRIETPISLGADADSGSRRLLPDGSPGIDYLVLDFTNVSEMDTSAIQIFSRLRLIAEREDITVVLTGLTEANRQRLAGTGFFDEPATVDARRHGVAAPSVGEGVAWCEEDLLRKRGDKSSASEAGLEHQLGRLTGDLEAAGKLAPYFEREMLPAGAYLFREGDLSSSMYILGTGVASVVVGDDPDNERVIRKFEEGTILGEMALFTGEPRSASVRAERDSVFFRLRKNTFREAQLAQPDATGRFLSCIVRLLAERLDRANREVRSLSS